MAQPCMPVAPKTRAWLPMLTKEVVGVYCYLYTFQRYTVVTLHQLHYDLYTLHKPDE